MLTLAGHDCKDETKFVLVFTTGSVGGGGFSPSIVWDTLWAHPKKKIPEGLILEQFNGWTSWEKKKEKTIKISRTRQDTLNH